MPPLQWSRYCSGTLPCLSYRRRLAGPFDLVAHTVAVSAKGIASSGTGTLACAPFSKPRVHSHPDSTSSRTDEPELCEPRLGTRAARLFSRDRAICRRIKKAGRSRVPLRHHSAQLAAEPSNLSGRALRLQTHHRRRRGSRLRHRHRRGNSCRQRHRHRRGNYC